MGASTSAIGPSPGARSGCLESRVSKNATGKFAKAYALMCNIAGRAKEIVLPEPVCAMATTSRPLRAIGHAWH